MQTQYAVNQLAASPGVIADLRTHVIESYLNGGAVPIPFGIAVTRIAPNVQTVQVPTADGQFFAGLVAKTDEFSQQNSGAAGYRVGQRVNVMRRGSLWVATSGPVLEGDPVFYNSTTGQLGPDAPATETAQYTASAGNTGNFTSGGVTANGASVGTYEGEFTDATHFDVREPGGNYVASGVLGTPFVGGGLTFTLTAGGTAAVPGDGFTIAVQGGQATTDRVPKAIWRTTLTAAGLAIVEINLP